MDCEIFRRLFTQSDNKPLNFPLPKGNSDAASDFRGLGELINEGTNQWETDRDIRIHALGTKPEKLRTDLLHVFPYFALLVGGPQQISGVERGNDADSVHIEKFAAQLRNRRRSLEDGLRGKGAETADDFRFDGGELPSKKWITSGNFIRLGIAIVRRPAFENVADIDLFALQIDGFDDLGEKLAGAADERQALLVFVVAGSFTDEYQFGIGIAGAKNDVRARWSELAALAVADFSANEIETLGAARTLTRGFAAAFPKGRGGTSKVSTPISRKNSNWA